MNGPLDEEARRLPAWREGVPITLGDGHTWHFPSPQIVYRPAFDGEGRAHLVRNRAALGPEIDPVIDRVVDAEDDGEVLGSALEMAIYCLRQNYRIEPEEFGRLLYLKTDDDANAAMWVEIIRFARGNVDRPKPSGDG